MLSNKHIIQLAKRLIIIFGLLAHPYALADESPLSAQDFQVLRYQFETELPKEFTLEAVNLDMKRPRVIHFHGDRLFAGSKSGEVYWLDPPYTETHVLTKLDNYPHSVAVRDNTIYIAQIDGVYAAPYSEDTKTLEPEDLKLFVSLPGGGSHNSRTLKLGPDNRLYVSLGIRGNCSDEYLDPAYPLNLQRGGIWVIDESDDQPKLLPYGTGLRNPVGFAWHPETKVMYATNNGPDHLGYELPPEYFSKILPDSFHGMPWFQYDGESIKRDSCIRSQPPRDISEVPIPAATFPARIAPMDLAFFNDESRAGKYSGNAVVALHGSWAVDTSDGKDGGPATRRPPKLVMVSFENGKATVVQDLLTGFQLEDGGRWARPMGVAIGPDGELYFTSDASIQGLFRLRYSDN